MTISTEDFTTRGTFQCHTTFKTYVDSVIMRALQVQCLIFCSCFEGYLYDSFPHTLITYGSNAAYGSYDKITGTACPSTSSTSYQSDYGEIYVVIPPVDGVTAKATVTVSGSLSQ